MNLKAFYLLGLLFAVVLASSVVTADQTSKDENTVVNEKGKEMNPEQVEDSKQGPGGRGYCGRCCWIHGNRYCGYRCCRPQKEESEVADETAAYQVQPNYYGGGWGGYPGWGWGRGWGGPGWGWGRGWGGYGPGGGWGGYGPGGGWGGYGPGWGGGWGGWPANKAGDDGRN